MADELIGRKFGRYTVIEKRGYKSVCRCDCGNIGFPATSDLKRGHSKSCGCLQREINIKRSTTHAKSKSSIYYIWNNMIARCYNKNSQHYKSYGGRGIFVSKSWHDFNNFLKDMGERPNNRLSLDRINNDGPYSKENCRWATSFQQSRNTRNNIKLTFNDKTMTLKEWSLYLGINYQTLHTRLKELKWPLHRALKEKPNAR